MTQGWLCRACRGRGYYDRWSYGGERGGFVLEPDEIEAVLATIDGERCDVAPDGAWYWVPGAEIDYDVGKAVGPVRPWGMVKPWRERARCRVCGWPPAAGRLVDEQVDLVAFSAKLLRAPAGHLCYSTLEAIAGCSTASARQRRRHKPRSVAEIAAELGVAEAVVRRRADALICAGKVTEQDGVLYATGDQRPAPDRVAARPATPDPWPPVGPDPVQLNIFGEP